MKRVWTLVCVFLMVLMVGGTVFAAANDNARFVALLEKANEYKGLEMTGEVVVFGFPIDMKVRQKGLKTKNITEVMGTGYIMSDGTDAYSWFSTDKSGEVIKGGGPAQSIGVDYNDPKYSFTFMGTSTVNGFECEKYAVKSGTATAGVIFLSTQYGVIIKSVVNDMEQSVKTIKEVELSDEEFVAPSNMKFVEVKAFSMPM